MITLIEYNNMADLTDSIAKELKNSIEFLNDKADVLLFTLSWLRDIDSAQVDSVVQILQSINKE